MKHAIYVLAAACSLWIGMQWVAPVSEAARPRPARSVSSQVNLQQNGSFESGDRAGWHAVGFTVTHQAQAGHYAGLGYLQFSQLESSPRMAVSAGSVYTVSGWMAVNGTDNGYGYFYVNWYGVVSGGSPIHGDMVGSHSEFTGGPDWRFYQQSVTAPQGATYATVFVYAVPGFGGSMSLLVDNVNFSKH